MWGTTNKSQLQRVQKLYNFSAKVAAGGRSRHDHASPVQEELKWLNVIKRIQLEHCIFMCNIASYYNPNWLFNIPGVSQISHRITRKHDNFYKPRANTESGQRLLFARVPRVWNASPHNIKDQADVHTFKTSLTDHVLHQDLLWW